MATFIQPTYGTWTAITCDIGALASDANLLAGRAGTVVSNETDRFDDVQVAGKVAVHASSAPTVDKEIRVYLYMGLDATPRYPDGITGSDANKTLTSGKTRTSGLHLAKVITVSAVAAVVYDFSFSLLPIFGFIPEQWGVFIVHDTGQALAASGSQDLRYRGLKPEVVTV